MSDSYRYPGSLLNLPVAGAPPAALLEKRDGTDAGERAAAPPQQTAGDVDKTADQIRIEEKVVEVLRSIYDPEIPVNIYDLGLIYAIRVDPRSFAVTVDMTLTAPACPVAESLPPMVASRIETLAEVPTAKVEVVWEPPWNRSMMSEAAQLELGLM